MSRGTQHAEVVEVAIGIVVDKMSPPDVHHQATDTASYAQGTANTTPRILITQRKAEQVLGGYWEFPGGKLEPNESPADAVVRELREEVGIEVAPVDTLDTVDHQYEHAHVRLIPFICKHLAGTPAPLHVDEVRWVTPDTLADHAFPDASLPILAELARWFENNTR